MRFDVDDPDVIPFRIFHQSIQASLYNTIRLGLLRIANPLTLILEQQPNIKYYLYTNKWIIVDLISNEFPLVVWRDFERENRGIHQPVNCKVHVYHVMAGRLMGTALYDIEKHIHNMLHNNHMDC